MKYTELRDLCDVLLKIFICIPKGSMPEKMSPKKIGKVNVKRIEEYTSELLKDESFWQDAPEIFVPRENFWKELPKGFIRQSTLNKNSEDLYHSLGSKEEIRRKLKEILGV